MKHRGLGPMGWPVRRDNAVWEFFLRRHAPLSVADFRRDCAGALRERIRRRDCPRRNRNPSAGDNAKASPFARNELARRDPVFVVMPQALRKVLPPLANQFISLIKDSAIISLISVQDLTLKTVDLANSTAMIFEAWLTTAALYFTLCFSLSLFLQAPGSERASPRTEAVRRWRAPRRICEGNCARPSLRPGPAWAAATRVRIRMAPVRPWRSRRRK